LVDRRPRIARRAIKTLLCSLESRGRFSEDSPVSSPFFLRIIQSVFIVQKREQQERTSRYPRPSKQNSASNPLIGPLLLLPVLPRTFQRRDVSLERTTLGTTCSENDKRLRRVLHDRDEIVRRELVLTVRLALERVIG
jgi:hypothetical protein